MRLILVLSVLLLAGCPSVPPPTPDPVPAQGTQAIVGTEAEVDAKIAQLNLK